MNKKEKKYPLWLGMIGRRKFSFYCHVTKSCFSPALLWICVIGVPICEVHPTAVWLQARSCSLLMSVWLETRNCDMGFSGKKKRKERKTGFGQEGGERWHYSHSSSLSPSFTTPSFFPLFLRPSAYHWSIGGLTPTGLTKAQALQENERA